MKFNMAWFILIVSPFSFAQRITESDAGVNFVHDRCSLEFWVATTMVNGTSTYYDFTGAADFDLAGRNSNHWSRTRVQADGGGFGTINIKAERRVQLPTFDDYAVSWVSVHLIWGTSVKATTDEKLSPDYGGCNFVASNDRCTEIWTKFADESDRCDTSPIVIDLDRDGLNLGGDENPVYFDLAANGTMRLVQWVAPHRDDAFLALDLNQNGFVDDGLELFGNGARLLDSGEPAANGFVALAQYDQVNHGGNDNGFIDPADAIWSQLLLWLDSNADGLSEETEMFPLAEAGFDALAIIPKEKKRFDEHGNWLRYQAESVRFTGDDKRRKHAMIDVYFKPLDGN